MHASGQGCGDASTSSSSTQMKGISAYTELFELHNGRHSTVWSARLAEQPDSVVVIKGYSKLRLKPRQLRNVTRELHLLRLFTKTRCKGVVQLLSSFEEADCVYLIFKACMHGDLYQLLVRHKGELTEEFIVVQVIVPLLITLAHLHRLHIVHRDIKPENIFINSEGEILIGDFGLAAHSIHDKLTERVGTLDYMAPEVLSMPTPDELSSAPRSKPLKPYTEKVDVWAVGILVYEMLAGAPPFEVEDPKETARLIMKSPVGNFPENLSEECKDFICLALEKKPSARPGALELLQHPWITHHLHGAVPEPPCPELSAKALKRIIHASWTMTSLASLFDTTPLPQTKLRTLAGQLPMLPVHSAHGGHNTQGAVKADAAGRGGGAAAGGYGDEPGPTSLVSMASSSKCRSLSSGDDKMFDSDTEGEAPEPAKEHVRISAPGNSHDFPSTVTIDELRASAHFSTFCSPQPACQQQHQHQQQHQQDQHQQQRQHHPQQRHHHTSSSPHPLAFAPHPHQNSSTVGTNDSSRRGSSSSTSSLSLSVPYQPNHHHPTAHPPPLPICVSLSNSSTSDSPQPHASSLLSPPPRSKQHPSSSPSPRLPSHHWSGTPPPSMECLSSHMEAGPGPWSDQRSPTHSTPPSSSIRAPHRSPRPWSGPLSPIQSTPPYTSTQDLQPYSSTQDLQRRSIPSPSAPHSTTLTFWCDATPSSACASASLSGACASWSPLDPCFRLLSPRRASSGSSDLLLPPGCFTPAPQQSAVDEVATGMANLVQRCISTPSTQMRKGPPNLQRLLFSDLEQQPVLRGSHSATCLVSMVDGEEIYSELSSSNLDRQDEVHGVAKPKFSESGTRPASTNCSESRYSITAQALAEAAAGAGFSGGGTLPVQSHFNGTTTAARTWHLGSGEISSFRNQACISSSQCSETAETMGSHDQGHGHSSHQGGHSNSHIWGRGDGLIYGHGDKCGHGCQWDDGQGHDGDGQLGHGQGRLEHVEDLVAHMGTRGVHAASPCGSHAGGVPGQHADGVAAGRWFDRESDNVALRGLNPFSQDQGDSGSTATTCDCLEHQFDGRLLGGPGGDACAESAFSNGRVELTSSSSSSSHWCVEVAPSDGHVELSSSHRLASVGTHTAAGQPPTGGFSALPSAYFRPASDAKATSSSRMGTASSRFASSPVNHEPAPGAMANAERHDPQPTGGSTDLPSAYFRPVGASDGRAQCTTSSSRFATAPASHHHVLDVSADSPQHYSASSASDLPSAYFRPVGASDACARAPSSSCLATASASHEHALDASSDAPQHHDNPVSGLLSAYFRPVGASDGCARAPSSSRFASAHVNHNPAPNVSEDAPHHHGSQASDLPSAYFRPAGASDGCAKGAPSSIRMGAASSRFATATGSHRDVPDLSADALQHHDSSASDLQPAYFRHVDACAKPTSSSRMGGGSSRFAAAPASHHNAYNVSEDAPQQHDSPALDLQPAYFRPVGASDAKARMGGGSSRFANAPVSDQAVPDQTEDALQHHDSPASDLQPAHFRPVDACVKATSSSRMGGGSSRFATAPASHHDAPDATTDTLQHHDSAAPDLQPAYFRPAGPSDAKATSSSRMGGGSSRFASAPTSHDPAYNVSEGAPQHLDSPASDLPSAYFRPLGASDASTKGTTSPSRMGAASSRFAAAPVNYHGTCNVSEDAPRHHDSSASDLHPVRHVDASAKAASSSRMGGGSSRFATAPASHGPAPNVRADVSQHQESAVSNLQPAYFRPVGASDAKAGSSRMGGGSSRFATAPASHEHAPDVIADAPQHHATSASDLPSAYFRPVGASSDAVCARPPSQSRFATAPTSHHQGPHAPSVNVAQNRATSDPSSPSQLPSSYFRPPATRGHGALPTSSLRPPSGGSGALPTTHYSNPQAQTIKPQTKLSTMSFLCQGSLPTAQTHVAPAATAAAPKPRLIPCAQGYSQQPYKAPLAAPPAAVPLPAWQEPHIVGMVKESAPKSRFG